jgi:hypothetical protein
MGAAAAIGGREFRQQFDLLHVRRDRPRCENGGGYPTSRTLDWDGSDSCRPWPWGHATYTRAAIDKLHVSGNPMLVPHVRVRTAGSSWTAAWAHGAQRPDRSPCHGGNSRSSALPAAAIGAAPIWTGKAESQHPVPEASRPTQG